MKLLEPYKMGDLALSNRMAMAPMTRSRANNAERKPLEMHAEYYRQRAGAGLIITEALVVSKQAIGYIHTPGIFSREQTEAWKPVTRAVHEKGGVIFSQLWHVGRISHPDFHNGEAPVAPSPINPNQKVFTLEGLKPTETPRSLSIEEIQATVEDFRNAARNAREAGFDGVEIHSSNGYLFHQFFSTSSNHRDDIYGGSEENKARFLFEVIDAIGKELPGNRIGIRLNPYLHNASGMILDEETVDTFNYIVNRLNEYDLAYLHLTRPGQLLPDLKNLPDDFIDHFRELYNGTLMLNGGYAKEEAEHEISSERFDLVAFGTPFIANPDLPERFRNGHPLAEPDRNTMYSGGEKGYIDYPDYK